MQTITGNVVKIPQDRSFILGRIIPFAHDTLPKGVVPCEGQSLPIYEYPMLASLLRADRAGATHFNLPDLRARFLIGKGQGSGLSDRPIREAGGDNAALIQENHLPPHRHLIRCSSVATSSSPANNVPAPMQVNQGGMINAYSSLAVTGSHLLKSACMSTWSSCKPHDNIPPYVTVRWCICIVGEAPSFSGGDEADIMYGGTVSISEMAPYAFEKAVDGWISCDGQELLVTNSLSRLAIDISGPSTRVTSFASDGKPLSIRMPDLRGRMIVGSGQGEGLTNRPVGELGGVEGVALTPDQMPRHQHLLFSDRFGTTKDPEHALPAGLVDNEGLHQLKGYGDSLSGFMATSSIELAGKGDPHNNMPAYFVANWLISSVGLPVLRADDNDSEVSNDSIPAFGYIGQLGVFDSPVTPVGWLPCDGRLLSKADYPTLYKLIGTTYGGLHYRDGRGYPQFALPDLRGRSPIGCPQGGKLGGVGGQETVVLKGDELAPHGHDILCGSLSDSYDPQDRVFASLQSKSDQVVPLGYSTIRTLNAIAPMAKETIAPTGGIGTTMNNSKAVNDAATTPHDNMPPYWTANWFICTRGADPGAQ